MTTTIWSADPKHSEIGFKVKHMMITNVSGQFRDFKALMEITGNNFDNASFDFTTQVASLSTHIEARDQHLRSADFFDAETFPTIAFKSTSFKKKADNEFELAGDLNMHGVSNPIQLEAEFAGITTDPWGISKAGLTVTGTINRKDWGLNWNEAMETGGVLVSEEVRLIIELQFIKQE